MSFPTIIFRFFSINILFLFCCLTAKAQDSCPCLEDDCGDILSDFVIEGGEAIVCDGYEFSVTNNTTADNITRYIWDWGDGTQDVSTTLENVTHIYDIPDTLVCDDDKTNYTICLLIVRECGDGFSCHSTSKPVGVVHRPQARFSSPQQVCTSGEVTFTNLSCNATNFSWDFGDGGTSTEQTPIHDFTRPGTYTVTLTVDNECSSDTFTRTIEVVEPPSSAFTQSSSNDDFCGPTTIAFSNQSNEWSTTRWEILPADTNKWMFTDTFQNLATRDIEVRFRRPDVYTINLISENICETIETSQEIEIFQPPTLALEPPGTFCDATTLSSTDLNLTATGAITEYFWTFDNGSFDSFTGKDFPAVTFTESGTISLRISSPCGEQSVSVPVVIANTADIIFGDNPTTICQNEAPLQLQASPDIGIWSGNNAISPTGLLEPAELAPGNYTFTYSTGAEECPNEASLQIEVLESVAVDLRDVDPACDQLIYTPNVTYRGAIDSYNWQFEGATPNSSTAERPMDIQYNTPGTFEAIVSVSGQCGTAMDTVEITVQQNTNLQIEAVDQPLCAGSSPLQLVVNSDGGRWSGSGVDNEGIFDPGAVTPDQTHTITYALSNGACSASASIDIEVVRSQSVTLTEETFCIDSNLRKLQASPTGGRWSGPGLDTTGLFNPAVAGVGVHPAQYAFVDPNGCSVSAQADITVEALPQPGLPADTLELCLSDIDVNIPNLIAYSPVPTGGSSTWRGPGLQANGTFNAGSLTEGLYTLVVDYERNDCMISDSLSVRIIQARTLALPADTTVCISENTLQLTTNLNGGRWSGPGIDENTGLIDLQQAGGDTHTYQYQFQPGTSCAQSGSLQVEIIDLSQAVQAGNDIAICEGERRYQLQGASPAGGRWEGAFLLDAQAGTIDLDQLKRDTDYVYQYCIESQQVAGCSACASRTFRLHSSPQARFTLEGTACINQAFGLSNESGNARRYNWSFGDGNSSTATAPEHTYRQQGTYTLELIAISNEGCRDTAYQSLYVTTPPTVAFTLAEDEGCAPFELQLTNNSSGDDISHRWYIRGDTFPDLLPGTVIIDSITTDSIFPIVLAVENGCGQVRDTAEVLVHPYPIVDFGISTDEGCSPLRIDFFNSTLGNPDTYRWDLGNGNSSTLELPPNQLYTTGDSSITVYTTQLIADNECGSDTLQKDITVYPPDVRAFIELDTLRGCAPFELELKSFATPGANRSWRFIAPDGSISGSEQDNPVVAFRQAGRHTLILYASNCGTHSDTAYLDVLPAPEVSFTHDPYVCLGQPISFSNTSEQVSGSYWSFGDSTFLTENSTQHVYSQAGVYTVELTAFSLLNNCPATDSSTVEVIGLPVAAFAADTLSGCGPLEVRFSNQSSGNGPLNYVWTFGDDASGSTDTAPTHTFSSPGTYGVRLTAFDEFGCFADTAVENVLVFPDPVSDFILEKTVWCNGHDTLLLQNRSSGAMDYRWRLEDMTYTDFRPRIPLNDAGSFELELIVSNEFNCRDSSRQAFEVLESAQANFIVSATQACVGTTIDFTNQSQFSERYQWTFADGNTSTDEQPEHAYLQAGTYSVQLIVDNPDCPADTAQLELIIHANPVAAFDFTAPTQCGPPVQVVFNNTSIDNLDNSWQFGDGSSSDLNGPAHEYTQPGTYAVQLQVANRFGCSDTLEQPIEIFGGPLADFQLSTIEGCTPLEVQLSNLSEQALSYRWTIEGLGTYTEPAPTLRFDQAGSYDIQLTAIYNEQCQDSLRQTVYAYQSPTADFSWQANPEPGVLGEVQFTNRSLLANRYNWNLGDGSQTDEVSPYHEYSINRDIEVWLTAYNDNSGLYTCSDSSMQLVAPEWITTFFAPNAFSPEYGPEEVRVFRPKGIGLQAYEITIYSAWGEQVWYSTALQDEQPADAWNGRLRNTGDLLPQGAYVWKARLTFKDGNERTLTGSVTMLR